MLRACRRVGEAPRRPAQAIESRLGEAFEGLIQCAQELSVNHSPPGMAVFTVISAGEGESYSIAHIDSHWHVRSLPPVDIVRLGHTYMTQHNYDCVTLASLTHVHAGFADADKQADALAAPVDAFSQPRRLSYYFMPFLQKSWWSGSGAASRQLSPGAALS